jgi:hypothetical protein
MVAAPASSHATEMRKNKNEQAVSTLVIGGARKKWAIGFSRKRMKHETDHYFQQLFHIIKKIIEQCQHIKSSSGYSI